MLEEKPWGPRRCRQERCSRGQAGGCREKRHASDVSGVRESASKPNGRQTRCERLGDMTVLRAMLVNRCEQSRALRFEDHQRSWGRGTRLHERSHDSRLIEVNLSSLRYAKYEPSPKAAAGNQCRLALAGGGAPAPPFATNRLGMAAAPSKRTLSVSKRMILEALVGRSLALRGSPQSSSTPG